MTKCLAPIYRRDDEVLLILYTQREIKKQRFKCWSDRFIIILIRETGKGRKAIEKRGKKARIA